MSKQPTRQLSLQQPISKRTYSKQQQQRGTIRRQRSADDNRSQSSGSLLYHSIGDQSLKSRRDKTNWNSLERPKVRIAWSSTIDNGNKVEVIASRIGTSSSKTVRGNLTSSGGSSSTIGTDKATILYSHQELAERLRVAWKQREANKSNIDIFLAHETTADDSRCESRLSNASCEQIKSDDNNSFNLSTSLQSSSSSSSSSVLSSGNDTKHIGEKEVKVILDARTKRASFQSGTNVAFTGGIQKNTFVSPTIKDSVLGDKLERHDKIKERNATLLSDPKAKRTNSAPPIQRRSTPTLTNIHGSLAKAKVNIIIDTPKIGRSKDVCNNNGINNTLREVKNEKKDWINSGKVGINVNQHGDDNSSVKSAPILSLNHGGGSTEKLKPITTKKRARSGKRRVEESGKKSELSKTNHDVVTMVSLVSDADSDSEIERNSPRDDKLVRQLRSNLPTTPIIKSCSPLLMNTGSLMVSTNTLDNSLMPRRVLKSVSFQQDSIDGEINLRPRSEDKKSILSNDAGRSIQQIIRGSSAHGDENKTSWYLENTRDVEVLSGTTTMTMTTMMTTATSSSSSNYWKECGDDTASTLTDREKRCLVVPIGDPQDKKRKILLQRTKSVQPRELCDDNQSTMQIETKETSSDIAERQLDSRSIHRRGSTAISLQTSISKLIQGDNFESSPIDMESIDALDVNQPVEPYLSTTKEKECWHLYRRMCDKGVCVSFDTVLRGMLTPTEYRLRRREIT
ncbi:hypothetical protein PV325_007629 [Microctonus aethiopoides]|uniref:Uncharacterized protein n=1 Tax=Microctonus aethiopoides TaxID=144406 RepID=A0AA39KY79_9HYME|nr:hypothetical protein PV325_007629 [Microctonus aethiopoides]KAK0178032.1 hypothetical protein PV328_002017 [Microctonus aethiopoides]